MSRMKKMRRARYICGDRVINAIVDYYKPLKCWYWAAWTDAGALYLEGNYDSEDKARKDLEKEYDAPKLTHIDFRRGEK